jgi:hypothetical protein
MFSRVITRVRHAEFRRGLAAGLVALAVTGTVAGCGEAGHQAVADANAVLSNPVATFTLNVTKDGLITLGDILPPAEPLTDLGVWGIDLLQGHIAKAHASNANATLLVITHTVAGKQEGTIYLIDTDRALRVTMNGKFVEEITPGVITITAQPGTDSTIAVSDANAGEKIHRKGTVVFWRRGYSADLDEGTTSSVNTPDAEILQGYSTTLTAINGTKVVLWPGPGQPSLEACESFPANQWAGRLSGLRLHSIPSGTTWCVHTRQGYYGVIVVESRKDLVAFTFSYVLWDKK